MPDSERSLVLVKPDGVRRALIGEVITRIEAKGLRVVALQLRSLDRETAAQHYAEHDGKPFFDDLLEFITGGPLVAMVIEGPRAIPAFRALAGATDPVAATPGTIRGDFALEVQDNIVHGSDSSESAAREIALFFPDLG
ncbi:MAG: nucleoside-diphosphate kinase [Actinomycetota bacterium]|nr:nucleoside-diphosphate kinase [Actinomycetota bacterium]